MAGLAAIVCLAACTPFSRSALQQVNTDAPFRQIQSDPEQYRGKTVLWGGSIISTEVRGNGTYMKVLDTRLDYETMPKNLDKPQGRFIVFRPGILDPAVYRQGRMITVIGTITGKTIEPLGGINYVYPVIEAQDMHLWRPPASAGYYSGVGPPYDAPYPPMSSFGWWW